MNSIADKLSIAAAHHRRGELGQAEGLYRQMLTLDPRNANVLHLLGVLLAQEGKCDEAIALLERATTIEAANATYLSNLGSAYLSANRRTEAETALRRATKIDPNHADAHYNLGVLLGHEKRLEDAIACYRRVTNLKPAYAAAYRNLGVALQELGRPDEALPHFEKTCHLRPDDADAHFNLGTALADLGDPHAAIASYEQALRLQPDHSQARCGRGAAQLSLGDFAAGWLGYEHRVDCSQFDILRLDEPRWDGAPLPDGTLLVHCEQGLGDTLQFVRFVPLAARRCGRLILAAQPKLIPLLAHSGFSDLVSNTSPLPPFDAHVPLLSLPRLLQADERSIPRDVPYLGVSERRIAKWRALLPQCDGVTVGIAWQGHRKFRGDRWRSIPLGCFAPLAAVPGARLVSLQKNEGVEQLDGILGRFEVLDLRPEYDEEDGAFLNAAAVIKNLDLVISADTAIAHLAGALGAAVWVALPARADWRWMLDRTDSPWYPTMRLFRQPAPADWHRVFQTMAEELRALIARRAR